MADTEIKHNYEGVKSGVNEENKFVKSESKIAEGSDKAAWAVNKAVTVPKTIYVETFAEGTEDGTEAHPYSDFKTAYRAAAEYRYSFASILQLKTHTSPMILF